jgi:hypothetical protein
MAKHVWYMTLEQQIELAEARKLKPKPVKAKGTVNCCICGGSVTKMEIMAGDTEMHNTEKGWACDECYRESQKPTIDKRPGSPFDRGAADSYYRRGKNPHFYRGKTRDSELVEMADMTLEEVGEYVAGFEQNKSFKNID